ncbi:NADH-ubiquinone oxidoreductase-F iron-sulfur binding region domain-containing protein [Streptomyces sp. NPDC001904]|uniref:NADH-ubiquinone oxidoreductase-F iron-sulfur binding region domain-containing protein n=1 Tax=Streptomyces sp. NPDC001904 TaxID=3154531 RepID=UPI0033299127
MDLRFGDSKPTDEERAAVDALLGPPTSAWEAPSGEWADRPDADLRWARGGRAARDRRDLLLPGLHAVNDRVGWISEGALAYLCRRLTVPPSEAYGVATFYSLFSVRPRPATVLHVCTDLACARMGGADLCTSLKARGGVVVEESPCLGVCERAPVALRVAAGNPGSAEHVSLPRGSAPQSPEGLDFAELEEAKLPQAGDPGLILLRRVGVVDPAGLDDYRAHGGYTALRRAFALGPAGVIREVTDAGLVGRGGAAFPTGRKWQATAAQPDGPHYLVCNADESEPGTFKDRVVMEGDPYALVEAMTIAAYATGAHHGYLYLRGEYPRALARMTHAVEQARARGLLGDDVLGQGFAFDIEIRRGAGAYICGEETALFNSIEGYRGEPRTKPPFPVEKGLFGKPTAANNVETLVNVLPILTLGAEAYAAIGTGRSTGPKLFCVSGAVARPGVYELPFGATLGELLALAGTPDPLRAILLGGAAGGFVRPDELDIPLTFEGTREAGTTLGSGVVMAFDHALPLPRILLRIAQFFREESCGQCVPCRVGTVRQQEALHRIAEKRGIDAEDDLALLREVGRTMKDASICGLGQTAWNAIESAVDRLGAYAS